MAQQQTHAVSPGVVAPADPRAAADLALPSAAPRPAASAAPPPLSERTGEIRRPALQVAVTALLTLGCLLTVAALVRSLLIMTGDSLVPSAWLVAQIDPEPSSWQAVLMPVMVAALLLPAVAASGIAAFQGWDGRKRAPIAGVVGAVLSLLGFLVGGPLVWAGIACHVIGGALLWLPGLARYRNAQTSWRAQRDRPAHVHSMPAHVHYGPIPRYR